MIPKISLTRREQELHHLAVVVSKPEKVPAGILNTAEKQYLRTQITDFRQEVTEFNRLAYSVYIYCQRKETDRSKRLESARRAGDQVATMLNGRKAPRVTVFDAEGLGDEVLAFTEGMALGCYQFLKYKQDAEKANTLTDIEVYSDALEEPGSTAGTRIARARSLRPSHMALIPDRISFLNHLVRAVSWCRDLINEPHSHLTATLFAREVERMASECGASVEVLNKQKLQALKMGGLLGVNQGSHEPPTFTVMEWKPENAGNRQPVVLVGKGVMYDTGGMNLKPGDTMLNMKDDMSGAAAVAATVYAAARAGFPMHLVGLMPATDNRPGPKAIVSGDILQMHGGQTVEVINTDAEGRLILADALSYAKKYDPALVIDLATLTGSAVRAIGKFGAAAMQSGAGMAMQILAGSGDEVYERLVEFPMWDEYGDLIKSDIADLKNLGPAEAGLITAGKFLEKFTAYPYIHLDIAGPAFLEKRDSYRGQGGTGFGVRLLADFLLRYHAATQARH